MHQEVLSIAVRISKGDLAATGLASSDAWFLEQTVGG